MDNNRFDDRLKRYVKVTTTLSGLVTRLAGEKYLNIPINHQEYAENLKKSLGNLKGPLVKIVQLLSSIPHALPEEYTQHLQELQANAPAMGWLFVKRRMSSELGNNWQDYFQFFESTATAAASLGQIHKARTKEGQIVACKLQYPGMDAAIEADLNQFKILAQIYESVNNAIVTADIQREISDRLREELDYRKEAQHLQWYKKMISVPNVAIPEPLNQLSTHRLLTMTWLDGQPLLTAKKWPEAQRNQLAYTFFKAWYQPFYRYGMIHGDPHLGNYSVQPNGTLNLFDFGCVRVFSPVFVQGVIDLYYSILHRDEALALKAYESWGFTKISKELMEILNKWARFLYGPLLEDKVRSIEETNNSFQGRQIAEEVYQALRKIGGVRPPKEFVLMDRATVGVGSVMMHLGAKLNWYQLFQELTENFNCSILEKNQKQILAASF